MVNRLLPVKKRVTKHVAFLVACIDSIQVLNTALFDVWFSDVKEKARRSAQRIAFEKALNDDLNPDGVRKITIENNVLDFENVYFHTEAEQYWETTYLGKQMRVIAHDAGNQTSAFCFRAFSWATTMDIDFNVIFKNTSRGDGEQIMTFGAFNNSISGVVMLSWQDSPTNGVLYISGKDDSNGITVDVDLPSGVIDFSIKNGDVTVNGTVVHTLANQTIDVDSLVAPIGVGCSGYSGAGWSYNTMIQLDIDGTNESFETSNPDIIVTSPVANPNYIPLTVRRYADGDEVQPENAPLFLDDRAVLENIAGFTVWIPTEVMNNPETPEPKVRATIDLYRVAGTKYTIVEY